jgi:hypothetical protein
VSDQPTPEAERPVEEHLDEPKDDQEAALQDAVDDLPVPDEDREVPPDVGIPPEGDDPMGGPAPSG